MCVCVTEDPGEGLSQGHSQASVSHTAASRDPKTFLPQI